MKRRLPPTLLHKMFMVLVMISVLMFLLTELLQTSNISPQPGYILQKTYMTAECQDKRLGNAMFIYATVVGLAARLNMSLMIQDTCRVVGVFNITAVVVPDITSLIPMHHVYEEYGRRASAYDIKTERLQRQNTILKGYFQSWKYFSNAYADVRREFTFTQHTLPVMRQFFSDNKLTDGAYVRVGIHVRRGDLLEEHFKSYGYTTADSAYFRNARTYFEKLYSKILFIVCSDDIKWAKMNIIGDNVIYSEGRRDYEDLAILSHCDHSIISVGSFGWWAAWLTNGTTLYYSKWPKEYSQLEYHVNKKTYFPENWIPME